MKMNMRPVPRPFGRAIKYGSTAQEPEHGRRGEAARGRREVRRRVAGASTPRRSTTRTTRSPRRWAGSCRRPRSRPRRTASSSMAPFASAGLLDVPHRHAAEHGDHRLDDSDRRRKRGAAPARLAGAALAVLYVDDRRFRHDLLRRRDVRRRPLGRQRQHQQAGRATRRSIVGVTVDTPGGLFFQVHGDNVNDSDGLTEERSAQPSAAPNGRPIFGRSVMFSVGYDLAASR